MASAISDEDERDLLNFVLEEAVRHIVESSVRLKCSFLTRCKALLIYHHFKRCVHEYPYDPYLVATACISLSIKYNEEPVEFDSILLVFLSMTNKETKHSVQDITVKLRQSVTKMESLILRMLEFSLTFELAFKYLAYFMNDIREELSICNTWNVFVETCTRITSDFYLTNRCINYKAEEIAVTVVEVALYFVGIDTDKDCHLDVWLKCLHDCPESRKCHIVEDIFRICDIGPVAESKREDLVRALAMRNAAR